MFDGCLRVVRVIAQNIAAEEAFVFSAATSKSVVASPTSVTKYVAVIDRHVG